MGSRKLLQSVIILFSYFCAIFGYKRANFHALSNLPVTRLACNLIPSKLNSQPTNFDSVTKTKYYDFKHQYFHLFYVTDKKSQFNESSLHLI